MTRSATASVIERLDRPAAAVEHQQQTSAVVERYLEAGAASHRQAIPPADVEGPGSGPADDRDRWP